MKECVKVFAPILYASETCLDKAVYLLEKHEWGDIDFKSQPQLFDVTEYYKLEMGSPLYRTIVSFRKLLEPSHISTWKNETIEIENALKDIYGNRTVNIDIGYIDYDKIVLASTKKGPYKTYHSNGIWTDMVMHYEKGQFACFPWSFADFKDGRYIKECLHIRELYKRNIRALQQPIPSSKKPLEP